MKLNTFRHFKNKKSDGILAGTIIIFIISFLIFCICAIDAGYTITSRYKTQKVTETIALYMASYLNTLPEDKKTAENVSKIKENFENLYSNYELSGYYRFEIKYIEVLSNNNSVKIRIETETSIPSLFLKYVGISAIKISQISHAMAAPSVLTDNDSDKNSYIYKANNIITDKKGDDLKIKYNKSYFVFAGLKTGNSSENDDILWTDIGSFSDDIDKKPYLFKSASGDYDAWCITKENTKYDFSKDTHKTIGLIHYIKIIETDDCDSSNVKKEKDTISAQPTVTVLNSVKLINREKFLEEDF